MAAVERDQSGNRWYIWQDRARGVKERYLSVTTIIDLGIPKPALTGWAAREAATWAVDNLPAIQALLAKATTEAGTVVPVAELQALAQRLGGPGISATKLRALITLHADEAVVDRQVLKDARQEAIDLVKGAPWRMSDKAKIRGSHVHDAIEAFKLERPYPGVPADALDYYVGFLRMLDDQRPYFLQTEANVYNRTRLHAGRLDTIGVWPKLADAREPLGGLPYFPRRCSACGRPEHEHAESQTEGQDEGTPTVYVPCDVDKGEQPAAFTWAGGETRGPVLIGDYKTGKGPRRGGVYAEVGLQGAAYRNSEFIAGPEGTEFPMPEVDGAIAIHLQPGWCELVPVETGDDIYTAFLYAREVARFQLDIAGTVVHQPVAVYEAPGPKLDPSAALAEAEALQEDRGTTTLKVATSGRGEDPVRHAVTTPPAPGPGKKFLAICGTGVSVIIEEGFNPGHRRACPKCADRAPDAELAAAVTSTAPDDEQPEPAEESTGPAQLSVIEGGAQADDQEVTE